MERYTMFLDWKTQHCENDYTTQSNLPIQYNPYQIPLAFFTELEQIILNICMELQRILNSQSNLKKKEQSGRHHAPWFQTIIQTYSV